MPELLVLQPPQLQRSQPDPPSVLLFFQSYDFSRQHFTQKYRSLREPDIAVDLHPPQLVVPGIFDIGQPRRKDPRRWHVHTCRRIHLQGLVWPLLVVALAKGVKGGLLCPPRWLRRLRCLPLQSAMQPFVPPILLGLVETSGLAAAAALATLIVLNRLFWIDWVEIRMSGERLDISSVLILLWLAYWGWAWGVVGLILAYPLLVSLKLTLQHFDRTERLAILMEET